MRVDYINGKIVCIAEDWKALTEDEHKFLKACYWTAIWTNFNADGNLEMGDRIGAKSYKTAYEKIISAGEEYNIAICDKVRELREYYVELVNEENRQAEAEARLAYWKKMQETGCRECVDLLRYAEDGFKCKCSGEDLDMILYNEYNYKTGIYEMFHCTGKPNEHCKYCVKMEIKEKRYDKV